MNNVERFDELYNINTMTTQKGSFFRLQKILFENEELKELSLEAKVLYAFMCDRIGLSVKNGWTDERGCIFIIYPVAEVCEKLGCKKDKARKILSELEHFGRTGLIRRKKQGLGRPDKIFVVEIKEEVVEEMNNVVRFDEFYNINTITTQKGSFFRLQKKLFEDEELKELSLGAKVLYGRQDLNSSINSILKALRVASTAIIRVNCPYQILAIRLNPVRIPFAKINFVRHFAQHLFSYIF